MYSKTKKRELGNILNPVIESEIKFNCKVRYFPDDQIKISCFSKAIFNPYRAEVRKKKPDKPKENPYKYDPEKGTMSLREIEGKTILDPFTDEVVRLYKWQEKEKEVRADSMKRAIDKAFEIGLANDFKYFVTLTLDREKIDRYDKSVISSKLHKWLNNLVTRNGMDYIIFPEYHKLEEGQAEKAIHFHGLINANNLKLSDSGRVTKSGQTVYNLDNWKYGFSTVIELDGKTAIVRYVTKYITKGNEKILGKFYFSGGRTLKRDLPAEYLNMDYSSFEGDEYYISAAHMSVKYKTFNLGWDNLSFDGFEEDD